ncbi:MAG: Gfo/Idh/MocA family oxidoreductase, partial [Capsulimonadales bacterium]|nr:Gfo/Idh/MocA family oxidoreductase [Capsulimonadales bacterium]
MRQDRNDGSVLRIAIIGMGGFAGEHHRAVQLLQREGECRLLATCDPLPERFAEQQQRWQFEERSVTVHRDYREMLETWAGQVDVVTVAAPIPWHAPMHRACVLAGVACYLEKPPTLDPDELESMIDLDAQAPGKTQVGFNFVGEPRRVALLRRIRSGEFGAVRRVTFRGLWPRSQGYFRRAGWVGRLYGEDGRLILDSCPGNAMAHHVQNCLLWAGGDAPDTLTDPHFAGEPDAELYRANSIETFDTAFLRTVTRNGVELRLAVTHAAAPPSENIETVHCDRADIEIATDTTIRITGERGLEIVPATDRDHLTENLRRYFRYVRGIEDRPVTRPEDCRAFVRLHHSAYFRSGGGIDVDPAWLEMSGPHEEDDTVRRITGIRPAFDRFLAADDPPPRPDAPRAVPEKPATPQDTAARRAGKYRQVPQN